MRRLAPAIVAALVISACGDSESPTGPTTPATQRFTLSGVVTDATSSLGLSGATVVVVDGPNAGRSTTTSSIGTYTLENLALSGFTVRYQAQGYADHQRGVTLT